MEIYLDNAASAPLQQSVKNRLLSILDIYANPSSLHSAGLQAKSLIDQSSDTIAKCLNCKPEELYYTSGATMANNVAIQGFLKAHSIEWPYFVTTRIEHDDIYLMVQNYSYDRKEYIPCDPKTGLLDLECLDETLDELSRKNETSILLSVQWANNEMGIIQDMRTVAKIVNSYPDVYLHVDGTQFIPYFPVDLQALGIDMLSCSAQKIGGLKGTGLLYVRDGVKLSPIIYGDQGLIGGTENVPGIVCMAEAFKNIDYSTSTLLSSKRDYLYSMLKDCGTIVGTLDNRLPNNLNMIFDGVRGEELQSLLSDFGIYVSTGSACSSHTDKPSRTLTAMGYTKEQANSSIRFSLGNDISYEDLDFVSKCMHQFVDVLRNK